MVDHEHEMLAIVEGVPIVDDCLMARRFFGRLGCAMPPV